MSLISDNVRQRKIILPFLVVQLLVHHELLWKYTKESISA